MNRPLSVTLLALILASHGSFYLLWLIAQIQRGAIEPRDWNAFRAAGARVLNGDLSLYPPNFFEDPFRFMYPPYGVWYFLPLAVLPGAWFYAAILAVQIGSIAAALRALRPHNHLLLVAALAGSAWLTFDLMVGQLAASYLLLFTLCARLWQRGMPLRAGLVAGLLALKPHLVWPLVLIAALTERRALAGLAVTGLLLLLSTAPFGLQSLVRFLEIVQIQGEYATTSLTVTQNATLVGFLRGFLGPTLASRVLVALSLPTLLAVLYGARVRRHPPDVLVSLAILLALSLNPYVNLYDLLVLYFPAATWLARRDEIHPRLWWAVVIGLLSCWFWDQWILWYRELLALGKSPVGSATGTLAWLWGLAWALQGRAPSLAAHQKDA